MAISDEIQQRPEGIERVGLHVVATLDPAEVVERAVRGLVRDAGFAFARVWRTGNGEDGETVLDLVASAGLSERLDGEYQRVPLADTKIGQIAARRECHWTNAVLQDPRVTHKEWAREHGLRCFAGHALVAGDDLLGVMMVFGRERLPAETFRKIGVLARFVALAIRNAERYQASATG